MNSPVIHGENCYSGRDDDTSPSDQIQPELPIKQPLPNETASSGARAVVKVHPESLPIKKPRPVKKQLQNALVRSGASVPVASQRRALRPDQIPTPPIAVPTWPITERIGVIGLMVVAVASVSVLLVSYAESLHDSVLPPSPSLAWHGGQSPSLQATAIGSAIVDDRAATAADLARVASGGEIPIESQQRNRRTASLPEEPEVSGDIASASAMIQPTSSALPARNTAPTAILPPGVPPAAVVAPSDSAVEFTKDEMSRWIRRGHDLLNTGDFAAARLLFKRAADGGSAQAALALGSSYDPAIIRQLGAVTVTPDIDRALKWYATAADLGSADAADRYVSLMQAR
jgi:hypothetical protein